MRTLIQGGRVIGPKAGGHTMDRNFQLVFDDERVIPFMRMFGDQGPSVFASTECVMFILSPVGACGGREGQ